MESTAIFGIDAPVKQNAVHLGRTAKTEDPVSIALLVIEFWNRICFSGHEISKAYSIEGSDYQG
jgi:hypothetical protein